MDKYILFYKKYKAIIIPFVFLIATFFIFIQVSLPNIYTILDLQKNVSEEEKKLSIYKSSYGVINSMDENILNDAVLTATRALPVSKDPGTIYLAVVSAATNSDVQLKSFSVNIGTILDNAMPSSNVPQYVSVTVNLSGVDIVSFQSFVKALMREVPLSNVTDVNFASGEGAVTLSFYYKNYDLPSINSENINVLTPADNKILESITF